MRADPVVLAHAQGQRPGALFLTPPVAAEVHYGIARLPARTHRAQHLRAEYARWRDVLRWLDWVEAASAIFGEQKARLDSLGLRIEDMDLAVAAIALAHECGVATCNARHFSRIEGLRVLNWAEAVAR